MGRKYFKNGFAFVQVLTTIFIVGVLIVLIMLFYNPILQIDKMKDNRRETDLKKIAAALENYIGDHPCYPDEAVLSSCGNENLNPYLKITPCDPETGKSYTYKRPGPACDKYILSTKLKSKNSMYSYNEEGDNYVVTSRNLGLVPTILDQAGGKGLGGNSYYGCFSGRCLKLKKPDCSPRYLDSNCQSNCVNPLDASLLNECISD